MSITGDVTEKFEDPFWECFGGGAEAIYGQPIPGIAATVDLTTGRVSPPPAYPPGQTPRVPYTIVDTIDALKFASIAPPTGYEYLAPVTNQNTARIAAIESKIAAGPGPVQNWGGRSILADLVTQSSSALTSIGQYVYRSLRDPTYSPAFLAQYAQGIAAADIASEQENLRQIFELGRTNLSLLSGPVMRNVVLALSVQIAQKTSIKAAATTGFTDATGKQLTQVASIAGAIPFVGQIASAFLNALGSWDAGQNAQAQAACANYLNGEAMALNQFTSVGVPFPITISEDIPSMFSCTPVNPNGTKSGNLRLNSSAAAAVLTTLFQQWQTAIPDSLMVPVLQWWALTLLIISDPRMQAAFGTLGKAIPQVGYGFASYVASDEQVYLVALPLAIIYNLDVSGFARVLWNSSNGWRDGAANSLFMGNGYSINTNSDPYTPAVNATYCVGEPQNAYIVNTTILCRDAWPLAQQVHQSRTAAIAAAGGFTTLTPVQKAVASLAGLKVAPR